MDPGFLSDVVKITKVADAAGAAATEVDGAGVDMDGYDGVMFLTSFATAAANNLMKAQQSDDDGSADDYSDIAGSKLTAGASDEDQVLDILQPRKRYVRPAVLRGTSSALGDIWAIQYKGRKAPIVNTLAGTIYVQKLYHPAEGTA